MKAIITTLLLTLAASAALAGEPKRITRTVVVSDGRVLELSGDDALPLGGKRGYLGVGMVDITTPLREHYGAPKDQGALVGSIEDDSPAAKAGLRIGDVITAVDGKEIASSADLRAALRDKKSGESVRVDIIRNRGRQTLVASVAEREISIRDFEFRGLPMEALERLDGVMKRPEFRTRVESAQNCNELRERIRSLEAAVKELEKKLAK